MAKADEGASDEARPLAWHEDHTCANAPGPCWKRKPEDDGTCANCGQPWPRCFNDDGLACLFSTSDMMGDGELGKLEAEIARRGIDPWAPKGTVGCR